MLCIKICLKINIKKIRGKLSHLEDTIAVKTSKFDWTPYEIRLAKISRFFEYHGPHFEFDTRSFNYSVSKVGSSEVIGERSSM